MKVGLEGLVVVWTGSQSGRVRQGGLKGCLNTLCSNSARMTYLFCLIPIEFH